MAFTRNEATQSLEIKRRQALGLMGAAALGGLGHLPAWAQEARKRGGVGPNFCKTNIIKSSITKRCAM